MKIFARGSQVFPWDIDCSNDVPITKQEFKDDCDANLIIANCLRNGTQLPVSRLAPVFADVTDIGDYGDCVQRIQSADEAFMGLPVALRTRFDNDPVKLINFLQDSSNRAEAVKLGLIVEPAQPKAPAPPVPSDPVPSK